MRALRATLAHEDIETTFSLAHKMCRNVLRKRMSTNLQMDEHSWILCMCGIRVCYEIKHPVIIVATRNDMVLIARRRMCINASRDRSSTEEYSVPTIPLTDIKQKSQR